MLRMVISKRLNEPYTLDRSTSYTLGRPNDYVTNDPTLLTVFSSTLPIVTSKIQLSISNQNGNLRDIKDGDPTSHSVNGTIKSRKYSNIQGSVHLVPGTNYKLYHMDVLIIGPLTGMVPNIIRTPEETIQTSTIEKENDAIYQYFTTSGQSVLFVRHFVQPLTVANVDELVIMGGRSGDKDLFDLCRLVRSCISTGVFIKPPPKGGKRSKTVPRKRVTTKTLLKKRALRL